MWVKSVVSNKYSVANIVEVEKRKKLLDANLNATTGTEGIKYFGNVWRNAIVTSLFSNTWDIVQIASEDA